MSTIYYDQDYLMKKWDSTKKNDKAVLGTSVKVKSGQTAVVVFRQGQDLHQDCIEGPCDKKIEVSHLPSISRFLGLTQNSDFREPLEIYFVNTLNKIQIKFGIPYFDVFDNVHTSFSVPVSVKGEMNIRIQNVEEFVSSFGLKDLSSDDFIEEIKVPLTRYVKDTIKNIPSVAKISCLRLEDKIGFVSDVLQEVMKNRLHTVYGIELVTLDISAININKDSDDYRDLNKIEKKLSLRTILHKARISRIKDDIDVAKDAASVAAQIIAITSKIKK